MRGIGKKNSFSVGKKSVNLDPKLGFESSYEQNSSLKFYPKNPLKKSAKNFDVW